MRRSVANDFGGNWTYRGTNEVQKELRRQIGNKERQVTHSNDTLYHTYTHRYIQRVIKRKQKCHHHRPQYTRVSLWRAFVKYVGQYCRPLLSLLENDNETKRTNKKGVYFINHLKPLRVILWGYPIFPAFAAADIPSSKNPYPTYLFPTIFFWKQEAAITPTFSATCVIHGLNILLYTYWKL